MAAGLGQHPHFLGGREVRGARGDYGHAASARRGLEARSQHPGGGGAVLQGSEAGRGDGRFHCLQLFGAQAAEAGLALVGGQGHRQLRHVGC